MSPLWRDEVGVYIGPHRVVFVRMKRGMRPRCVAERSIPLTGGPFTDWRPAVAAMRSELSQEIWANANVRIIIADRWARYAIVPWSKALRSDQEREAQAGHVISEMYGDGRDWTLALSDAVPGHKQVVTALPTELVSTLRAIVSDCGSATLSIEPQLAVAFNMFRTQLPRAGCWFVCIDAGSLAAAHVTQNSWDRIHCVRLGECWTTELHRLRLLGNLVSARYSDQRIFVRAPVWMRPVAALDSSDLEWLEDSDEASGSRERVAALLENQR